MALSYLLFGFSGYYFQRMTIHYFGLLDKGLMPVLSVKNCQPGDNDGYMV
ncbi:protein of unknown function [Xenorhabdus poinarii G6]|uniref:Uncharacterized protein n=1 Tax=Xenorhabdus poinarii G6 TaxID=1354304 RepID=A0A068R0P6_9GAMM|nr:protein of unknown function [Xenorhabdus poinarii G6]